MDLISEKIIKLNLKSKIILLFLFLIIVFSFWTLFLKDILNDIETITYDWRSKIAAEKSIRQITQSKHDKDIIIIAADDDTTKILENYKGISPGRWPWSRKIWGDVVNFINKGNPEAIVFDLKFEGSQGNSKPDIQADNFFADSIKNKNIVIATALSHPRNSQKANKLLVMLEEQLQKKNKTIKTASNESVDNYLSQVYSLLYKRSFLPENLVLSPSKNYYADKTYGNKQAREFHDQITFYERSSIYPKFITSVDHLGVINLKQNNSLVFRDHIPVYKLVQKDKTIYLPSLAFAAVLSVIPDEEKTPFIIKKDKIILGKRHIPIDKQGSFLINWHGVGGTYNNIPVARVILSSAEQRGKLKKIRKIDRISPEFFKDKIVIIGQTSAGTDIHPTPVSSVYPGPEIIATAIDNILNDANTLNPDRRKFIKKSPVLADLIITIFLCFLICAAMIKSRTNSLKISIFSLIITFYLFLAVFMFVIPEIRIWLNITYPIIFMILSGIGSYAYLAYNENKERKQVELMFGKFVSPQILEKLLNEKKEISRTARRKVMTVLFSDIRNFTTMSEQIPADEVVSMLNEYMTEMVEIILSHNGTLDKYIGDAIMAFYNDPVEMEDHPLKAVLTAIDMQKRLYQMNIEWKKQNKPILNIGIGINTGEMVVGHMGSQRVVDYTVIGDNVNIASRIESLTKEYNAGILITESTNEMVKDKVETEFVAELSVKGRKNKVKIFKIVY